jgi:hypothetical protein
MRALLFITTQTLQVHPIYKSSGSEMRGLLHQELCCLEASPGEILCNHFSEMATESYLVLHV